MNLPELSQSLCEQLGLIGDDESRNVAILDAVDGTLRIAYRQGEAKALLWRKEPPDVPGYWWRKDNERAWIIPVSTYELASPPKSWAGDKWCGPIHEPKDA